MDRFYAPSCLSNSIYIFPIALYGYCQTHKHTISHAQTFPSHKHISRANRNKPALSMIMDIGRATTKCTLEQSIYAPSHECISYCVVYCCTHKDVRPRQAEGGRCLKRCLVDLMVFLCDGWLGETYDQHCFSTTRPSSLPPPDLPASSPPTPTPPTPHHFLPWLSTTNFTHSSPPATSLLVQPPLSPPILPSPTNLSKTTGQMLIPYLKKKFLFL